MARTSSEGPSAGDTYITTADGERVLQRTTRQWALTVPAYTLWSAGVRYTLRGANRIDHTFALNVNNIFDKDYLKANKQLGDRRAVYFTYTVQRWGAGR